MIDGVIQRGQLHAEETLQQAKFTPLLFAPGVGDVGHVDAGDVGHLESPGILQVLNVCHSLNVTGH